VTDEKLRKHIQKSHTEGVGSIKCNQCNFKTQTENNMQKHVGVHEKPFECKLCEKKFKTRTTLNNHDKIKHRKITVTPRTPKEIRRISSTKKTPFYNSTTSTNKSTTSDCFETENYTSANTSRSTTSDPLVTPVNTTTSDTVESCELTENISPRTTETVNVILKVCSVLTTEGDSRSTPTKYNWLKNFQFSCDDKYSKNDGMASFKSDVISMANPVTPVTTTNNYIGHITQLPRSRSDQGSPDYRYNC
jgi:hypothetical protein